MNFKEMLLFVFGMGFGTALIVLGIKSIEPYYTFFDIVFLWNVLRLTCGFFGILVALYSTGVIRKSHF